MAGNDQKSSPESRATCSARVISSRIFSMPVSVTMPPFSLRLSAISTLLTTLQASHIQSAATVDRPSR